MSVLLFDNNGVRSVYAGLKNLVGKPNNCVFNVQKAFDDQSLFLQASTQLNNSWPSEARSLNLADFQNRFMKIIENINQREDVRQILKGPCLPLFFAEGSIDDLGVYFEDKVIPAIKYLFKKRSEQGLSQKQTLFEITKTKLSNEVGYVPESKLDLFLNAKKSGSVVAAYFPNALRAWSILAAREQMSTLPPDVKFVLSDIIIHGYSIIEHFDIIAMDGTPGVDCSASTGRISHEYTFFFKGYERRFDFYCTRSYSGWHNNFSSGLLVLE
jgi:hypothetical protein